MGKMGTCLARSVFFLMFLVIFGVAPAIAQPQVFVNSIGMEFARIPEGSFLMGCGDFTEVCYEDETPRHRVTITKPFYMGKYLVTQKEWLAIIGSNPSSFKGDTLPVDSVSWNDAQAFIVGLNAKEGINKYRLATEAEWEYAARAGTASAFSFGNDESQLGEYGWFDANSGRQTHPVGQLQPNAWGLYDMHGNLWEWVQDYHAEEYYLNSSVEDPTGPETGDYRVKRGGGWISSAWYCRSAHRIRNAPDSRYFVNGFRIVMTIDD